MNYRDYTIDILFGESLLEMGPSEFSFSMSDDIFSFFPTVDFQIKDVSGLLMEHLAFSPGEKLDITYGRNDFEIQSPYINKYFESEDTFSPGFMNGLLTTTGIHAYSSLQTRESFAYDGSPSSVIEELIADFTFNESKIDSSENNHTWYRPFYTQQELIEKVLLENVYSNDANDTPFFCFIDSNNTFHFESFFTLFEQTPIQELELYPGSYEEEDKNRIIDLKPLSEDYLNLRKTLTHKYFRRNNANFEFTESERNINSLYPGDYLVSQENPIVSNYTYFGRTDQSVYENDILGQQLFKMRSGFLTNKVFITLPLNANLTAGKTVDLSVATSLGQNESSLSYSGKYLIEKSNHIWNGETQNGYSQLLLSRKNKELPSDFLIKNRLYSP